MANQAPSTPAMADAQTVEVLNAAPFHHGEMPINEQTSTYHFFDKLWRWGGLTVAAFVLFLVMMFCTGSGFIGSAMAAVVVAIVGFFVLKKPTSLETT